MRRLGRFLVYELFQLALRAALVLRTLAGLRSAWRGGTREGKLRSRKAIRPRRALKPVRLNGFGTPAGA